MAQSRGLGVRHDAVIRWQGRSHTTEVPLQIKANQSRLCQFCPWCLIHNGRGRRILGLAGCEWTGAAKRMEVCPSRRVHSRFSHRLTFHNQFIINILNFIKALLFSQKLSIYTKNWATMKPELSVCDTQRELFRVELATLIWSSSSTRRILAHH